MLTKDEKKKIIEQYGGNSKNTGLSEVQIALLSKEIKLLTTHFSKHKKDNHSKMGLYKKIALRDSLLRYLKKVNYERYTIIIEDLKIRGVK